MVWLWSAGHHHRLLGDLPSATGPVLEIVHLWCGLARLGKLELLMEMQIYGIMSWLIIDLPKIPVKRARVLFHQSSFFFLFLLILSTSF